MATMRDIAAQTGLSVATISKYVNGGRLKAANEEKIRRAIGETHYTVNDVARSLKTSRSLTVGAVIPSLNNLFMNGVISHTEEILRQRGYGVLVCDCMNRAEREGEAVAFLLRKRIDALLWVPLGGSGEAITPALERRVPVVLLDRQIPALADRVCAVLLDNRAAARTATERLLALGHRRIGVVLGPEDVFTAQERLAGWREALRRAGAEADEALIRHGAYTAQDGYRGAMALLHLPNRPTAILSTNYETTLGTVLAVGEAGLRVPEEMSLIGFDGQDMTGVIKPPLTLMAQPVAKMGSAAARALLEQMARPSPGQTFILSAEAVEGASVAPPKSRITNEQ